MLTLTLLTLPKDISCPNPSLSTKKTIVHKFLYSPSARAKILMEMRIFSRNIIKYGKPLPSYKITYCSCENVWSISSSKFFNGFKLLVMKIH